MKKLNATAKTIVCENKYSPFRYFGWPTVARLQNGDLAMTCSGLRLKHVCPFGKVIMCVSKDEGKTWSTPSIIIDTPLDDRDSGVLAFGENRVLVTSFNNMPAFQKQNNAQTSGEHSPRNLAEKQLIDACADHAEAFGQYENLLGSTYRISSDGGVTFGEIKLSPVTAPHGPILLHDGTVLYVGSRFDGDYDRVWKPHLAVCKLNDKDEFDIISAIPDCICGDEPVLSCEPHAIETKDGTILVHIRVQRGGDNPIFTVFQTESHDGGLTFTTPHRLLSDKGGSPAHLMCHSSGVLISTYGYREAPYGERVMFSYDGGKTWDTEWILDDTAPSPDLGYPATVELSDGRLLTVFYENTGDASPIFQQIWELPNK